ncbi:hypothetical protein ZWY2020_046715 [Hordeum vulgare]|nr:hypothetical protein ZWY2020_046715 [Hordeum vulgare]
MPITISLARSEIDRAHTVFARRRARAPEDGTAAPGPPGQDRRSAAPHSAADAPPSGRADGTAIDSLGWQAKDRPLRADGVTMAPWDSCTEAAPPAARRPLVCMLPWPGRDGARHFRWDAKRGKAKRKEKRAPVDGPPPTTAADGDVGPAGSDSLRCAPAGSLALAAIGPDATPNLNPVSPSARDDGAGGPNSGPCSPMPRRDPAPVGSDSEADSQLAGPSSPANSTAWSGQSDALAVSPSATVLEPSEGRSPGTAWTKEGEGARSDSPAIILPPPPALQDAPPHVSAQQPATSPPRPKQAVGPVQDQILPSPSSSPPHLTARGPIDDCAAIRSTPNRFASPPVTFRHPRERNTADVHWTLGDFLAAATKQIAASLLPGRKKSRPRLLSFSPPAALPCPTAGAAPSKGERLNDFRTRRSEYKVILAR